jgi:alcohol dehydrogenase (cytochrome c)
MKSTRIAALLGLALIPVAFAAQAVDYTPVTHERLVNPEPGNWLHAKGNYQGWSYTPLEQINTRNVKKLVPVWSYSTGVGSGHEAPALINNGVMFVTTPYNQVLALNAKNGELIWKYKKDFPEGFSALHITNRGVALWGDKVYVAGLDCTLNALDAKTGKVVWTTEVCDWTQGAYITSAPVAVKGKIFVGPSGGEFGIRGFLKGFDAETGKEVWHTWSVPSPGDPGSETWPQEGRWKDAYKIGGGTMWMPGNYDPVKDMLYWGVGNGSPWFGDQRPGDNLYVASVLAMDPDNGNIKSYFQYHHNDSWDWAGMNAPTLVEFNRGGKKQQGMISAQRNGYMYFLDRDGDGSIVYKNAKPFVKNNVFSSLDPKTGRTTYNEDHKPGTGKAAVYCPSLWGGKDWPYEAYSPKTGMLYVPFNDNHCMSLEGKIQERIPGQWSAGVDIPDIKLIVDKNPKYIGGIQAWDINSGKEMWRDEYKKSWNWGSIMATAGGLIFAGGTSDRMFRAYDAKSGKMLWEFKTNSGIIAPPSSFSIDGKQYIAVTSGWGVDAAFVQGLMHELSGWEPKEVAQGGTVWVFALQD